MTTHDELPEPITEFVPGESDQDWQTVRDQAVTGLRSGSWTDHNVSDPGITMLEAGALSVAEAHMRTELVGFAEAPIGSAMWRNSTRPSGIDLPATTEELVTLADALATNGQTIVDHVASAAGRAEAVAALSGDPALGLSVAQAGAAVQLHRSPIVAVASFDYAGAIDAAVEAVGDQAAVDLLRLDPSFDALWDTELLDVLELRRRRRFSARLNDVATALAAATTATEVTKIVAPDVLDPSELLATSGLMARPEVTPETFEGDDGETHIWPPTQIQSRAVEPVTADDYARLALGVDGVRRAWVKQGQMVGVGWDGFAIEAESSHPGALTILVEADDDAAPGLEVRTLRALAGPGEVPEVDDPYALYGVDPSRLVPRRMICDEIGVAIVKICEIEVRAALHVAVGTVSDRSITISAAHARVADYLRLGRAESQAVASADSDEASQVDGPWPLPDPPPTGWVPGEPIRLNEIIQLLGDDPVILGVSEAGLRVNGGAWFTPGPADVAEFVLEENCLPRLDDDHCLTVAFVLEDET